MMADSRVVVVTGGAGFIGSHTVERLLELDCRVVVLDNFHTGSWENLAEVNGHPSLRVIEANVADGLWPVLVDVEREWGAVDAIVHLAAQTSVIYSMLNPLDDMRNNYISTAQVLEYARSRGVRKVVFSSSSATYGDVQAEKISEDVIPQPLSPYGIHKLSSEYLLTCYKETHGIATIPLRFFNVYGPRQDPKSPYAGVISLFAKWVIEGQPLTIFGDGEQTRDFVYVKDVAAAVAQASLSAEGLGRPVNIGTGQATTINQLAIMIRDLCGAQNEIKHLDARAGEIRHSCAVVERARQQLGFVAQTSVEDGLRDTIAWMREGM